MVDLKALYWTGAWINMLVILGLGFVGIRQIATARYDRHRGLMLTAVALVMLFVLSYALKLLFLGRETLETWSVLQVWILRVHELCVAVMLVGGAIAVRQALHLKLPLGLEHAADRAAGIRLHRCAGFTAVVGAALGVLTAAYVLGGMYTRLGGDASDPERPAARVVELGP